MHIIFSLILNRKIHTTKLCNCLAKLHSGGEKKKGDSHRPFFTALKYAWSLSKSMCGQAAKRLNTFDNKTSMIRMNHLINRVHFFF